VKETAEKNYISWNREFLYYPQASQKTTVNFYAFSNPAAIRKSPPINAIDSVLSVLTLLFDLSSDTTWKEVFLPPVCSSHPHYVIYPS
jgi:hypothetical protein